MLFPYHGESIIKNFIIIGDVYMFDVVYIMLVRHTYFD